MEYSNLFNDWLLSAGMESRSIFLFFQMITLAHFSCMSCDLSDDLWHVSSLVGKKDFLLEDSASLCGFVKTFWTKLIFVMLIAAPTLKLYQIYIFKFLIPNGFRVKE